MSNSTVLALVQSFCREYGLLVPTALQGSSDAGALQMRELLQTVGEDIWAQTNWQQCSRKASWLSVAGSAQGAVATLFPEDMDKIIPQTFWDETAKIPFSGPVSDFNWQANTAYGLATPYYYYRVAGGQLEVQSDMPVDHTLSLIYKSRRWISCEGVAKTAYSADTDVTCFSDALMKKGLRAFWLRLKQMPHKYEFQAFEDAKMAEAAANVVAPILQLDRSSHGNMPGIMIPLGNWTV